MRTAAPLVALLIVLAGVLPAAALSPAAASAGGAPPALQATAPLDHETDIVVDLRRDTAAEWTVETRFDLDTENETAAFRTYAEGFRNNETPAAYGLALFERAAERASGAADRNMRIVNTTREATVVNDTGVLRLTFVWTAFLAEDGSQLVLGDALRTPGNGTWLRSLEPGQQIVIRTPPGYTIDSTNFPILPRNGSIIVDGPQDVGGDSRIQVVYARQQGGDGAQEPADTPWELIGGGIVVAAALVAAVVLFSRRDRGVSDDGAAADPAERPPPGAADDAGVPGGESGATVAGGDGTGEAAGGSAAAAEAGEEEAADGDREEDDGDDGVDLSLLSDEERVEHLLERNGGRMKQANIVRETGWSDAKVSQLLSSMADEGRVDKLRLGRENLISLPDDGEGDGEE